MDSDPVASDQITIRPASAEDAERIAILCHQLGYPSSHSEVVHRLDQILNDNRHAVFVATLPNGEVVGWVHALICHLLVLEKQAEIDGLVVDERYRCRGIGRLLMRRAEEWARETGCQSVYLRSNVIRKEAHKFYDTISYTNIKTQKVFRKVL